MATHMRTELVTSALDAAIVHCRPGTDLVHHSDHGAQYTSLVFGRRLRESGIAASMGSVGDCYDNLLAESFFATLETELIDRCDWASPAEARAAVFEYIEVFYNRVRRHSSLGNSVPSSSRSAIVQVRPRRPDDASPSTKPGQLQGMAVREVGGHAAPVARGSLQAQIKIWRTARASPTPGSRFPAT
jgi:putative transposase